MLQKLKAMQWFISYLFERIFLVNIESKLSDFRIVTCRVLQWSILCPPFVFDLCIYQNVTSNQINFTFTCRWFMHLAPLQRSSWNSKNSLIKTSKISMTDLWISISIHFGRDKTKSILLAIKQRLKIVCQLNILYKHINIK